MKLKEYIKEDKPREKLEKIGVENLSDSELLCILLRTGNKNESVNELSNRILKESNGLINLMNMSLHRLTSIKGIKLSKASILLSALEIGKRSLNYNREKLKMNNTLDIFNYFKNDFINERKEHFYVLLFDQKMNFFKVKELFKGTVSEVEVHIREVFKEAIIESASFIIVMHNHPSGDTTPSKEDIDITNKLIEASKILNIKFIDHIIISSERFYSFRAENQKQA